MNEYNKWQKKNKVKAATVDQIEKAKWYSYGTVFHDLDIEMSEDNMFENMWETLYEKDGEPAYPWLSDKSVVTDKDQFVLGFMYGVEMLLSTLIFWMESPEDEPED